MQMAGRTFGATLALGLALLATAAAPVRAQNYPERAVRIVSPYPPGGSVDLMARVLAAKLAEVWGASVIVENRSGAGGNTGAEYVAKSEPDGYTLLFTAPGPLAINQTLYTKGLNFDPDRDFAPIALFGSTPLVMMASNDLPARNVQELIALARQKPGTINYASAGVGTTPHLTAELFKSMAGVNIVHVPYRGTGPALVDLMAGHIELFFDLLPNAVPQIKAGKVKALGNAGPTRPASLADLPTVAEQGVPGFSSTSWWGFVGPAKMPEAVKAKLIEGTKKVLSSPDIIKHMRDLSAEPGDAFGKDFAAFLAAEEKKWGDVVRVSGAHAD
jgi:tripartite-type tricarboxylate transporter receptor subunit TctC